MPTIKTLDFVSRLGDVYFVVYNTLNIIKRPDVQNFIVNTMMQGTDTMLQELQDAKVFYHDDPEKINELKQQFFQALRDSNAQKVKEYAPILLNQNLVMMCTTMEIFFLHILKVAIDAEPRVLNGLAVEKQVALQRILELGAYEKIINEFEEKIFDHFSRQGLKEKFKIYDKVGLDTNIIFDYSSFTDDAKKLLEGYDLEKLDEIFNLRHDIVHKSALPLNQLEELNKIKDFFEKIIFNLSTLVMRKYGVLLDLQENLVRAGYPRDKMVEYIKTHDERENSGG